MNPTWPQVLQDRPNATYSETMIDGVIRSNPDIGPTMSRPRFTKTRIKANLSFWVDREGYVAFLNFYNIDLAQGSLAFDWTKPITALPATFKFLKAPAITAIGPLDWNIDCELEEV
jgi:hypothetical protein